MIVTVMVGEIVTVMVVVTVAIIVYPMYYLYSTRCIVVVIVVA